MSDLNLSSQFNAQCVPRLSARQREDSALRRSSLVMIFEKDTRAEVVANTVTDTQEKTGIESVTLVSRATDASGVVSCEHVNLKNSLWLDKKVGSSTRQVLREVSQTNIARKWKRLQKPERITGRLEVEFSLLSSMTSDEMNTVAQEAIDRVFVPGLAEGKQKLQDLKRARSFVAPQNPMAEVYEEICYSPKGRGGVDIFAFIRTEENLYPAAQLAIDAAEILQIPAGLYSNRVSSLAFPDGNKDKVALGEDCIDRTTQASERRVGASVQATKPKA